MIGVYMVPTLLVIFLFNRFGKSIDFEAVAQNTKLCILLMGGAVLLAAVTYVISYFISLNIYKRKEF